jgi:hypothetical protein
MALRKQAHATFGEVDSELKQLDDTKEEKITFASRAPNSGDKGRFWMDFSGAKLYFRHPNTGAWTAV